MASSSKRITKPVMGCGMDESVMACAALRPQIKPITDENRERRKIGIGCRVKSFVDFSYFLIEFTSNLTVKH